MTIIPGIENVTLNHASHFQAQSVGIFTVLRMRCTYYILVILYLDV